MVKQNEKKDWIPFFTVIIFFLTALSHKGTFDFFNLKKYFIEYFSYSFVSCPCDNFLTKFLEYPVAYFFLTLIYLIIILLPIYLLSVLLKKLIKKFEDKSKNYEFRLFIFTISIYETILLILYFTTEIFEERTSLFFVLFLVIPFFYFIFLKIFKNWVK
jgi:hypothetical protein